ncbi:MAG: dethiobiotin synthase [Puniceicoccales bacterium]|jgi:dethiobiotin synthetase/malonyl-CoA O-methyltransferase|nr:dethiobiotin synthase [Puniceicoccales bacterium]
MNPVANIFVTGTDTDVGKTLVSAWLCRHTSANYWKPIQTGDDYDGNVVAKLSPHTEIIPEAYKLKAPLSPYAAAKAENLEIDPSSLCKILKNTVIEGAGGVLVPIAKDFFMADLIEMYCAAALIVAKPKLGVINHLLMTEEILRIRGINIVGVVMDGEVGDTLVSTIREFSRLEILATIPRSDNLEEILRNTALPQKILQILK